MDAMVVVELPPFSYALEKYDRDFFVVFAHVEADSGLWAELDGGRLTDLSKEPLIKKYCLGFQKVRTHDKGAKCRLKVQSWWERGHATLASAQACTKQPRASSTVAHSRGR